MDKRTLLPRHAKLLNASQGLRAERILDIGCGDGSLSVLLKEATGASEAWGIEISPEATENAQNKGIKAVCFDLDLKDFPFKEGYFDGIFAGAIIEHLSQPDHFLQEIHRVLKPNGWAIISTCNLASWHSRLHLLMGYQPYPVAIHSNKTPHRVGAFMHPVFRGHSYFDCSGHRGREHVQFFTLKTLKELAQLHGFRCHRALGSPDVVTISLPWWLNHAVGMVDRGMAKIPALASHITVLLRKL
jgi:SAM-dependent methyltransferase